MPLDTFTPGPTVNADGKQGTLVIAGFLGRGNAGDEAMFQVLYEAFAPRFNIVACVDEHGAYPGYWNWFPYPHVRIVHQNHIDIIERLDDCAGLIVGGGMLSLGFAAGHVLLAKARDIPVALAGVDIWPVPPTGSNKLQVLKAWYGLFTRLVARTKRSADDVRAYGCEVVHGGDWALRLIADSAPDVQDDPRRAVVVLREDAFEAVGEAFPAWVDLLLADIEAAGYRPVLLPFSPEDERFADGLRLSERFAMERAWWNARRLKQVIGASGLLVTVGRLHPMIFGAPTGCAIASVRMPHWTGARAGSMIKLNDMAAELGIASFDTREAFAAALRAGEIGPADEERLAMSIGRVERSLALLHRLFKPKLRQSAEGLVLAEAV